MQRNQIFEFARSVQNRKSNGQKSGKLGDADRLDDIGVFSNIDTRAGEAKRKSQSRRRLKLMYAAPKQFSIGLQEDFASRRSQRIRKRRNLGMFQRLGTTNPDQRRTAFGGRQRTSDARFDGLKLQNHRLAAARARDTGGDSELEV